MPRLLILGGTAEAGAIARVLADQPEFQVITSLAGRTQQPDLPPGEVRSGGFGGPEGLASYLVDQAIDVLIDATHPFARAISEHAASAASQTGIPRLRLVRRPWEKRTGDRWIEVVDMKHAAASLPSSARRVFLTTGHQGIDTFAAIDTAWFLIRTIEPVRGPRPKRAQCLTARGPFTEAEEQALLQDHQIDTLVTKASGGEATYAKIAAARSLSLPVIMIQRPLPPPGPIADNTEDTLAWLRQVTA